MTLSSTKSNEALIQQARNAAKARVIEVLRTALASLQRLSDYDSPSSRAEARRIIGLPPDPNGHYIWDETKTVGIVCTGATYVRGETPVELDTAMATARNFVRRITDSIEAHMAGSDATTATIVAQFDKAAR